MEVIQAEAPVYNIVKKIGDGLSADVYLAIRRDSQGHSRQKVVLKVLKSENLVHWLRSEFQALQSIQNQNCVRVLSWENLSVGQTLVLEHIEGLTLLELSQRARFSYADILEVTAQILIGLSALHEKGMVHGDLSPRNVMLDRHGQIKLIDFGSSLSAEILATPDFAAPETLRLGHRTPMSDLWSLGKIIEFLAPSSNSELRKTISSYSLALLAGNPQDRCRPNLFSDPKRREALADKINHFMIDAGCDSSMTQAQEFIAPDFPASIAALPELQAKRTFQFASKSWLQIVDSWPFRRGTYNISLRGIGASVLFAAVVFGSQQLGSSQVEKVRQSERLQSDLTRANLPTEKPSESKQTEQVGVLEIRTLRWVRVRMAGQDWQYTPLTLENLPVGEHQLEYKNQRVSGILKFKIESGLTTQLTDLDFKNGLASENSRSKK